MSTSIGKRVICFVGLSFIANIAAGSAFTPLAGFPGHALQSHVVAISSDGDAVAGHAPYFDASRPQPAIWDADRQITSLNPLPVDDGIDRIAAQISSDGAVIIGTRTFPGSDPLQQEAFRWTAEEGFASLGIFPGAIRNLSYAAGLSASGDVIAGAAISLNDEQRAFRWTKESGMVSLSTLRADGTGYSRAADVSADGSIVIGGADSELGYEPFRWTAEGMVGLGDLSGGDYGGYASSMSNDGSIVVGASYSEASGGSTEAFRWTEATGMQPLGFLRPSDAGSYAIVVSADGDVIFGSSGSGSDARSFVWDQQHGMRDLRQALESNFGLADALANWDLGFPTDISADGLTIVGNGINPAGLGQGWVITLDHPLNVPEPTAVAILLTAATLLSAQKVSRRC